MENNNININVEELTKRLIDIREKLGLKKAQFILRSINIKVNEGEEIPAEELSHPSGILIDPKTNSPIFAYIRDHTLQEETSEPSKLKKLHFMFCTTLKEMDKKRRFKSRYHITHRTNNKYLIEFSGGVERNETLYPCQNCLAKAKYKCFDYEDMSTKIRQQIVENFDAKEAIDLLWQIFDNFKKTIRDRQLRSEYGLTNYTKNWKDVSYNFRESKNFTCEKCTVNLSKRDHRKLIDTHHKDSNKRNNQDDNLECLCKICHSEEHPHYKLEREDIKTIEAVRAQLAFRRG